MVLQLKGKLTLVTGSSSGNEPHPLRSVGNAGFCRMPLRNSLSEIPFFESVAIPCFLKPFPRALIS